VYTRAALDITADDLANSPWESIGRDIPWGMVGQDITTPVTPVTPVTTPATGDETSPYVKYLTQIGLLTPSDVYDPARRFQEELFDPISALQGLEQRFVSDPETGPGTLGEFVTSRAQGFRDAPGTIYGGAGNILKRLLGMTPGAREEMGYDFGARYPLQLGGEPKRGVTQQMQKGLLQMALQPTFGVRGAERFATRLPTEERIWEQKQATGAPPSAFLDWLSKKYNLGAI